jgi:3-deoxy-D-manno-octulosonic-acid transferase
MNMIFLQKADHLQYFREKGFINIQVAGDTRIDRSLDLPKEAPAKTPSILSQSGPFDLVAGSTWPADEKILIEVIERMNLRAIIAPHDVYEENLRRLENNFSIEVVRLSALTSQIKRPRVILVDKIGLLSALYALGEVAYVGGGFGSGIHNILEPLAHQKPVIFGPKFSSFPEAVEMVDQKAAWTVHNSAQLNDTLNRLKQPGEIERAAEVARVYLEKNKGASDLVVKYILESIPCNPL